MNNAEAINRALVAASAARLAGFENTQHALLNIVQALQKSPSREVDAA